MTYLTRSIYIASIFSLPLAAYSEESAPTLTVKGLVRVDAVQEKSKAGTLDSQTTAEGFRANTATLATEGKYKKFGYVLRLDLRKIGSVSEAYSNSSKNESKGTGNDVDGLSNVVTGAEVSRKFGDSLTLSLGRTWLRAGSVENQMYLSWDQYLWSYYADQLEGGELLGQVGTALTATVDFLQDQQLVIQIMNGRRAQGSTQPQGGMTTGVTYYGNIFGAVKPVLSVVQHRFSRSKSITIENGATTETKYGSTYAMSYGLGTQVVAGDALIDLEYNIVNIASSKKIVANVSSDTKAQSYRGGILQVKYSIPETNFALLAKTTLESHDLGEEQSKGNVDYRSVGVAAEYWDEPAKLKYFAAYSVKDKTQKAYGNNSNGAKMGEDLRTTDTGLYVGAGIKL